MRKFIAVLFIIAVMAAVLLLTVSAGSVWGDVNSDGTTDISDSVKLAQYLANWEIKFSAAEEKAADVAYDNKIDISDAVKLAQYLAGWSVVLGDGTNQPHLDPTDLKDIEIEAQELIDSLTIYPEFPSQIRRNYDYDVSVTVGERTEKLPVYNHTMEYNCARRPGMDMYRRFSMFSFDDVSVRVDIKVKQDFTSYTVFPSAKNFLSKFDSTTGTISVYLDEPDYFGILLDDDQNSIISIFADHNEDKSQIPTAQQVSSGKAIIIKSGEWYEVDKNNKYVATVSPDGKTAQVTPGVMRILSSDFTIYIAPGGVLNARVKLDGERCKIIGRGAIVDPFENIYEYDIRKAGTEGTSYKLLALTGKDSVADGPVLLDARCYNIAYSSSGQTIRNIKALSTMMTTDGITASGSKSLVEHCWLYVADNGLVVSGEKNSTFRDIAIGTTCAAIFPQASPRYDTLEDINIFRADDGIISNRYNGGSSDLQLDITFKRLNAVELPAKGTTFGTSGTMHLFQGANTGTMYTKVARFEDVSVMGIDTSKMVHFRQKSSDIKTDRYTLSFTNVSINGKTLKSMSDLTVLKDAEWTGTNVKITVSSSSSFKPVTRNQNTVNYTAKNKVYIGSKQVVFNKAPTVSGSTFSLPASEICKYLRVTNTFGSGNVTAEQLGAAGYISGSRISNGNLYLTPAYKSGTNILLADSGEISYFSEQSCYNLDLVGAKDSSGTYLNVYPFKNASLSAGISRYISDDIKMYGTGTYTLTFKAKANKTGKIRTILYKDGSSTTTTLSVGTSWQTYTVTFKIDNAALTAKRCLFTVIGNGSSLETDLLNPFSLRDFKLVKTN